MSYSPPPGFVFLHETRMGTAWFMRDNGPYMEPDYLQVQDTQAILDQNVAMANHNDGWSIDGKSKTDKLMRRQASIPWSVITDWKENKGLDFFSMDQDMQKRINRELNSSDFQKLRTANYKHY